MEKSQTSSEPSAAGAPGAASAADTTVAAMIDWIRRYTAERDWEKFHNPKDLAVALAIEVGEVLESFRFRTNDEIAAKLAEPGFHREFGHELADCLWMLLRLADVAGVDPAAALAEKMKLAAVKYPADVVRGKPHKYIHYQRGEGLGERGESGEGAGERG
jgi:dCTP diphosphatase